MQSAAQRDATRNGAGGSGQGERSQPFRADLVHWKWQANYWRSQHARAKERIAEWQAKWKATQQELADALQKLRGLRQQVQDLQQENEGLRQENKQLLQSPFKKRSEKSKSQGQGRQRRRAGERAGGAERAGGGPGRDAETAARRAAGRGRASPGGSLGPGGAGGGARAGGRPLRVSGLRAALQPQRRGGQRAGGSLDRGAHPAHPPTALPGELRVRAAAGQGGSGGHRAAGAGAVPGHELRTERVADVADSGVLAAASGAGVRARVGRLRGAPAGGHATGACGGFPDLVRAAGRGDRGAPGAGAVRARGRDLVGGACVGGSGGEPARLDVGVRERGRGALSGGPLAQRRGGRETVRPAGAGTRDGAGVRPLRGVCASWHGSTRGSSYSRSAGCTCAAIM